MKAFGSLLMFLGRLCLSAAFIWDGFYKIFEFHTSIQNFQELTGVTGDAATWIIIVSLIVEIVFGIMLILGWKARFAALVLAAYVICYIVTLHAFWTMDGADRDLELVMFLKGIGIVGGLLYVMACGSGGCGCDRSCSTKEVKQ